MFRAVILPIFRSTRQCVTACGIMHRRCCRPMAGNIICNTQSSAPEDEQNNCPKHVELTGIINKPLLLHLVGCLYYLYQWCTVKQISNNEIYLLIKYIKSLLWRVEKKPVLYRGRRCLKVNILKRRDWIGTKLESDEPIPPRIILKKHFNIILIYNIHVYVSRVISSIHVSLPKCCVPFSPPHSCYISRQYICRFFRISLIWQERR